MTAIFGSGIDGVHPRPGPASWCKPDWQDDDLFKLSTLELETLKLRVAVCLKARFKNNVRGDFGFEVADTKPLDPTAPEPDRGERCGEQ